MNTRRAFGWLSLSLIFTVATNRLAGAEANPPPPAFTGGVVTNGQRTFSWTPYPAAEQYRILSSSNLLAPFIEDLQGVLSGNTWVENSADPLGFHRLQVTPLSSNALFAATVLNRLTYGPSPDSVERIAAIGPQAFIDEQMNWGQIAETIDTDPPITNTPIVVPPPAPLTNWIRVAVTGTSSGLNFGMYFGGGAGRVYIDDVRLVYGTNADVGSNLLANADFEDPELTNGWIRGTSITSSTMITNSPTVDGLAASGTNCVLLVGNNNGTLSAGLYQPYTNANPPSSQRFTLSFSYLPVRQTVSNVNLIVRMSGTAATATVPLPNPPPTPPTAPTPPPAVSPAYEKLTNTLALIEDLRSWHVLHAVRSQRQLYEILVQFFDNHLCTQYSKTKDWFDNEKSDYVTNDTVRARLATEMDWREHARWRAALMDANCNFYDLLKISIESPAMIIYLDTVLNKKTAANENYAREILELHAFGADNGYVQQDIVELAKVWTGWSVDKKAPADANNPFAPAVADRTNDVGVWTLNFVTNDHSYATKRMFTNVVIDPRFGPPYGSQPYSLIFSNYTGTNGLAEGYAVIDHLAKSPHTAEFLSVKLCRLFVHENFEFGIYDYTAPNPSLEVQLVKACINAWDTPAADGRRGNIRSILNVIFNSDLFRGHAAAAQKVKTPLELAVSAVRALRLTSTDTNGWISSTGDTDGYGIAYSSSSSSPLVRMGNMSLFNKAEPDGYSEFGRIWLNTANLCERMRFVQHLLMPTTSSTKDDDYGSNGTKNSSNPAALVRAKLPAASWNNAGAIADYFLGILYPGEGRANLDLDRQAAINFLNTDDAGAASAFNLASHDTRLRGMVALLMCSPRFQEQ